VPDVNCRLMTSCSSRLDWRLDKSTSKGGICVKGRNFDSSFGMPSPLSMIMMCVREGRTGEEDDKSNDGTRCCINGRFDRAFNFGVVIKILVPSTR